jgi:hypothetical protein
MMNTPKDPGYHQRDCRGPDHRGSDGGERVYRERDYRRLHRGADLTHFQVSVKETDLDVGVSTHAYSPGLVLRAANSVRRCRLELEAYIARDPVFASSLEPWPADEAAPEIARVMAAAAALAGVGPMAAVAGAMAEWVGRDLRLAPEVERGPDIPGIIVENGGDIYLRSERDRRVSVFAGTSPFSGRLGLLIPAEQAREGLGVCTSSGTVGPSLSFGCADAVVVVAHSTPLADAVATSAANRVTGPGDLEAAVAYACSIEGILGAVAILGDHFAAKGRVTLEPLGGPPSSSVDSPRG